MAHTTHRYRAVISWEGSTGAGYDHYDRTHRVAGVPTSGWPAMSADPAFGGDPSLANPEQLLVVAASSCQLLAFLAVAARARVDVVAYEDRAEALMPEQDRPIRITEIHLHPTIHVRGDIADPQLERYVAIGHRECFIASSLRTEITVSAQFVRVDGP